MSSSKARLIPFLKRPSFDRKIKEVIGYWPKEAALYKLALRHASAYPFRKKKGERNNERLEFLGDAVIDLVVADILYYRFPTDDEGHLTKLRSKIVSRNNLNSVADILGVPNLVVANLKGNHSESIYCFVSNDELYDKVSDVLDKCKDMKKVYSFEKYEVSGLNILDLNHTSGYLKMKLKLIMQKQ